MTNASKWFLAVNTMSASGDTLGRVLSAHRSLEAAEKACRRAQPDQRYSPGSYLPCIVRESTRRLGAGSYVPRHADWHTYCARD